METEEEISDREVLVAITIKAIDGEISSEELFDLLTALGRDDIREEAELMHAAEADEDSEDVEDDQEPDDE